MYAYFWFENGFTSIQFKSVAIPECFLEIYPVVFYEAPNKLSFQSFCLRQRSFEAKRVSGDT